MTNLLIYTKPFAMVVLGIATIIYIIYLIHKDKKLEKEVENMGVFCHETKPKLLRLRKDQNALGKVFHESIKDSENPYLVGQLEEMVKRHLNAFRTEIDTILGEQTNILNDTIENFDKRQLQIEQLMQRFSQDKNE